MPDTLKMKERLLGLMPEICVERARYLTRSYQETEGKPEILRRAKALDEILSNITVNVWPDELIVGGATSKEVGGGFYPDCNGRIWPELESVPDRDTNPFSIQPQELRELKEEIIPYWTGQTIEDYARSLWSQELSERVNVLGSGMILTEVAGLGHILLDHSRVVREGLNGVIREIEKRLSEIDAGNEDGKSLLEAAKITCKAVITFARRHADKVDELVRRETSEERKKELEEIGRICRKVPAEPAETFWESLQSIYFVHIAAQIEDYEKSISFGGIDRYLGHLYDRDLESGRLTREEAQTLLECFYLKLNTTAPCFDYAGDLGFCSIQSATNLIVGGVDQDGNDVVNDLSFLAIDARERVCMHEPNFGVRIHKNTNPEFLRRVSKSAATGEGHLQLFNDDIIIQSLVEWGITRADAADYGVIGCVELGIPGRTFSSANAALLDLSYCLELALNRGRKLADNMMSPFEAGKQMGLETDDPREMRSIDDLIEAFAGQVEFLVDQMVAGMEVLARVHSEHRPLPFISSLVEDCLSKGADVMWGGAKYNFTAIQGIGMATVGDSLAAIDKLVFQEKKISIDELIDALANNFEGSEPLRQLLVNKCPKFGNDDDAADTLSARALEIFCNAVRTQKSYRGGRYQPGFFSSNGHVAFGLTNPASPSGRRMGEPLSVGVSPSQGMNTRGPTAALNSAAKLDFKLITNGSALNLEFSPSFFPGEEGAEDFANLLQGFFELGGMHLQCNMVSRETLLAAKETPELYRDLLVRPAGFSVCFVNLNTLIQDEIISRTEYQP